MYILLGRSGGMLPRKVLNFRSSQTAGSSFILTSCSELDGYNKGGGVLFEIFDLEMARNHNLISNCLVKPNMESLLIGRVLIAKN